MAAEATMNVHTREIAKELSEDISVHSRAFSATATPCAR